MSTPDDTPNEVNPQKQRTGWSRLWHAAGYSMAGLRAGWGEKAFRLEAQVSLVMLPLAFWLARSWVEGALLAGTVILVMVVELLNTAIESAIDRTSAEWHPLSKRAKDLGSAAVLLSLVLAGGVWAAALIQRLAQTA
jgi:diacylglycerol kinase (ATP)